MAVVYATLIVKGKKTLEQVPASLKVQVAEMLKDLEVEVQQMLGFLFYANLEEGGKNADG